MSLSSLTDPQAYACVCVWVCVYVCVCECVYMCAWCEKQIVIWWRWPPIKSPWGQGVVGTWVEKLWPGHLKFWAAFWWWSSSRRPGWGPALEGKLLWPSDRPSVGFEAGAVLTTMLVLPQSYWPPVWSDSPPTNPRLCGSYQLPGNCWCKALGLVTWWSLEIDTNSVFFVFCFFLPVWFPAFLKAFFISELTTVLGKDQDVYDSQNLLIN